MQVMLAPSRELAENVQDVAATVEAEYGDYCVEGNEVTLAHHGSRSSNPAPCNTPNVPTLSGGTILVSHLDLDAIGGVLDLMGKRWMTRNSGKGQSIST